MGNQGDWGPGIRIGAANTNTNWGCRRGARWHSGSSKRARWLHPGGATTKAAAASSLYLYSRLRLKFSAPCAQLRCVHCELRNRRQGAGDSNRSREYKYELEAAADFAEILAETRGEGFYCLVAVIWIWNWRPSAFAIVPSAAE